MTRPILGLLVTSSAVLAAVYASGGTIQYGAVLGATIMIAGIAVGAVVTGQGFKSLSGFRFPSAKRGAALETVGRVLAPAALLCFLLRFVSMMKNLEDRAALWPRLAEAVSPFLIALVFHSAVVVPLKHRTRESSARDSIAPLRQDEHWSFLRLLGGLSISAASIVIPNFRDAPGTILLDGAAFIAALFVPAGIMLTGTAPRTFRNAFAALRAPDRDPDAAEKALRFFELLTRALRLGAAIGSATGFVCLMNDWTDRTRYGPTLALALLSAFWCTAVLALVAIPLEVEAARQAVRSKPDKAV